MKKLLSHQISRLFLIAMSSFSILLNANQAIAFEYGGEEEQENKSCCLTEYGAPFLAGALVAGGVALLAVNHCRDGSDGNTGPTGSSASFSDDEGQTLAFDFSSLELTFEFGNLNVTTVEYPFSVVLTPFVIAPDGTITQGESVTSQTTVDGCTQTLSIADLGTIIIDDPVFGGYDSGVQISIPDAESLSEICGYTELLLRVDVTASRDDSETTIYGSEYSYVDSKPSSQYQIIADFGYSCEEIP